MQCGDSGSGARGLRFGFLGSLAESFFSMEGPKRKMQHAWPGSSAWAPLPKDLTLQGRFGFSSQRLRNANQTAEFY